MSIKFKATLDMANQRITSLGSPAVGTDAVNKNYVDAAIAGLDWKQAVRAAPTGPLDLTAPGGMIDGVAMTLNDRVLVMNQADGAENGIYVWNGAASQMTRAADVDSDDEVNSGVAVTVTEGTVNGDRAYLLTTNAPITVGTTPLSFSAMAGGSGGVTYAAGDGLLLNNTTFTVKPYTGIIVGPNGVSVDTAKVARKFAFNIGDGAATVLNVNHGLNTLDVIVQVVEVASNDTVYCDARRVDANNVRLTFGTAPAAGSYRVLVQG